MSEKFSTDNSRQRFSQAIDKFRMELDRLADMAWTRGEEVWGQFRGQQDPNCDWSPAVDLVQTDDSVIVFMNLPGLGAEDIELTLVGNTLEVTAELNSLTLQESDRVIRRERPTGRVHRTIPLPCQVENESAHAVAERGVIKIEMKKAVDNRIRRVPITQSSEPASGTTESPSPQP